MAPQILRRPCFPQMILSSLFRPSAALRSIVLLAIAVGSAAVTAGEEGGGSVLPDLGGTTWVRNTAPPFEGEEGLCFEADGSLGLIGISAMNGLTWKRIKNALNIATNTTFRAAPEESELYMLSNDGARLVLNAQDDYLAGPWYRDQAAGVVRGQVNLAGDVSDEAALHVELRELEPDGRVGRMVGKQALPLAEAHTPFPFRVYFATKDVRADRSYAIAAVITEDGALRYVTTRPVGVKPGQTAPVTLSLTPTTR